MEHWAKMGLNICTNLSSFPFINSQSNSVGRIKFDQTSNTKALDSNT